MARILCKFLRDTRVFERMAARMLNTLHGIIRSSADGSVTHKLFNTLINQTYLVGSDYVVFCFDLDGRRNNTTMLYVLD